MNPRVRLDRQLVLRLLAGHPVQVPTSVGMLELEVEQQLWHPMERVPMTPAVAEVHRRIGIEPDDLEIWSNDIYEVFAKPMTPTGKSGPVHLSIKRYDRMPVHNWRHLQQMKNEICGAFREAVELYPSEARIADNANQTHLWVMEEGSEIPVGFPSGFTLSDDEVERMNASGGKARQEPQQPGLTTGDHMRKAIEQQKADPKTREMFDRVLKGDLG